MLQFLGIVKFIFLSNKKNPLLYNFTFRCWCTLWPSLKHMNNSLYFPACRAVSHDIWQEKHSCIMTCPLVFIHHTCPLIFISSLTTSVYLNHGKHCQNSQNIFTCSSDRCKKLPNPRCVSKTNRDCQLHLPYFQASVKLCLLYIFERPTVSCHTLTLNFPNSKSSVETLEMHWQNGWSLVCPW